MNKIIYQIYQIIKNKKGGYPISPLKILKELKESQYWEESKIQNYQLNLINNLIVQAKNETKFYSRTLSNITVPLKNLHELNSIPEVYKEDIASHSVEFKTGKFDNRYKHTTSGSSGTPLSIYLSGIAEVYHRASSLRSLGWWGVKPSDKSVLIWGKKETSSSQNSFVDMIKMKLRNRYDISVFDLNKDSVVIFFNEIQKFKPVYIRGYKSALLQFAELMDINHLRFKNVKLKVIIVTSETLLEEERNYIEKIFKCRVANEYGASEAGYFANECPEGSLHINEESIYLTTNNLNEALITDLFNNSMPLINYNIGDQLTISDSKCRCGRNSRIIKSINGRVDDFIIRPDGSKLSQWIFYYIVKELDDVGLSETISKYKIIQENNTFQVILIPRPKYNSMVESYIRKRMLKEIGEGINIEFKIVDTIPREKSGKLKFFSRIA